MERGERKGGRGGIGMGKDHSPLGYIQSGVDLTSL